MATGLCPVCGTEGRLLTYPGAKKFKCSQCGIVDLLALALPPPEPLPAPVIYANGHDVVPLREPGADEAEDEFITDEKRWQAKMYDDAEDLLRHDQTLSEVRGEALVTALVELLGKLTAQMRDREPPAELTSEHILEGLEKVARMAITENRPGNYKEQLPAKLNQAEIAEFENRAPIDAYVAYEAMRADARGYSVDGLIKDGCTALLSGLIGSGKSTMAMNFARAWALGTDVLGRKCRQSKRVFVVVSSKEYEAWTETVGFWGLKDAIYVIQSSKVHFGVGHMDKTVRYFKYWMDKLASRVFVLDTLFDFMGVPPNNTGDSNRMAMNEQTPLLDCVMENNFSGLVTGHAPKSEAYAMTPRDPEEAFGGHNAWSAQHRMRMVVRRKSAQAGVNSFITGQGGYGDVGVLKEEIVLFDKATRIITLGGPFSEHMGRKAMPEVIEALGALGGEASMPKLVANMGKPENWVRAGVKLGEKQHLIKRHGQNRSTTYVLASHDVEESHDE